MENTKVKVTKRKNENASLEPKKKRTKKVKAEPVLETVGETQPAGEEKQPMEQTVEKNETGEEKQPIEQTVEKKEAGEEKQPIEQVVEPGTSSSSFEESDVADVKKKKKTKVVKPNSRVDKRLMIGKCKMFECFVLNQDRKSIKKNERLQFEFDNLELKRYETIYNSNYHINVSVKSPDQLSSMVMTLTATSEFILENDVILLVFLN